MFEPAEMWKERLKHEVRSRVGPRRTQKLKKAVGRTVEGALWVREYSKRAVGKTGPIDNLYHACVQKTGSQWVTAVLGDRRIQRVSGLAPFPRFRYEWGEFRRAFPHYTFVSGLFIPRGLYEEIQKPESYRTIYVMRDPRDTVLSWYHSIKESHRLMGKVFKHRPRLRQLDFDEGLAYCIRAYQLKFSYMRSWAYATDDPNTLFMKLEELGADPVAGFGEILDHCGIDIEESALKEVLADYTKEKMRQRDLAFRDEGEQSHYRKESTDWREAFSDRHRELFRDVTGNLVELLGYESF